MRRKQLFPLSSKNHCPPSLTHFRGSPASLAIKRHYHGTPHRPGASFLFFMVLCPWHCYTTWLHFGHCSTLWPHGWNCFAFLLHKQCHFPPGLVVKVECWIPQYVFWSSQLLHYLRPSNQKAMNRIWLLNLLITYYAVISC